MRRLSLTFPKVMFATGGVCLMLWWIFMTFGEYYPSEEVITICRDKPSFVSARTKPVMVILLSYFGSGSNALWDIFKISSDVFLLNEPLMYATDKDILVRGTPLRTRLQATYRDILEPPKTLDFIIALLSCNFTADYLRFLDAIMTHDSSLKDLKQCTSSSRGLVDLEKCAMAARERCEKSSTVVARTLRLKMWEADILLSCYPNLKIIHLVRDPRGVAELRLGDDQQWNPETFCQRFNADAILSSCLHSQHHGRLIAVRQEDLSKAPQEVSHILFQFSNIKWADNFSEIFQEGKFLRNETTSSQTVSLINPNSSYEFNWRKQVNFQTVRNIQEKCFEAMHLYRYNIFSDNKSLRDTAVPSMTSDYSVLYNKALAPS